MSYQWTCRVCDEGNSGRDQQMRVESRKHCLETGHSVDGKSLR